MNLAFFAVIGRRWPSASAATVLAMLLMLHLSVRAESATSIKLIVEADDASGGTGLVKVSLWRDNKTFLKGEPYRCVDIEMKDGRATATFSDLDPGEFAISAYRDKNNNGRLDTGFAGKPTEPYGFSNDAKGRFGPPKFEQARFRLDNSKTIHVHLN